MMFERFKERNDCKVLDRIVFSLNKADAIIGMRFAYCLINTSVVCVKTTGLAASTAANMIKKPTVAASHIQAVIIGRYGPYAAHH